jgi:hypothetical protein
VPVGRGKEEPQERILCRSVDIVLLLVPAAGVVSVTYWFGMKKRIAVLGGPVIDPERADQLRAFARGSP